MTKQWFDVDRAGLGKQAEQHGKGRLVGELVQNALDEAGVTRIDITLVPVAGRPLADLTVEDDSPEGFKDLSHAYTLFAESYKRVNPEQRGQFDFGEKLVLAVCEQASISTTKGTVVFDSDEGRVEHPRQKRDRGSVFQGRIRLTREEYPQVCDYLRSLLLPDNVTVTFNGDRLPARKPFRTFEASLETPVADESGVMRLRVRKTQVSIYEALPGEVPSLYEMGLPDPPLAGVVDKIRERTKGNKQRMLLYESQAAFELEVIPTLRRSHPEILPQIMDYIQARKAEADTSKSPTDQYAEFPANLLKTMPALYNYVELVATIAQNPTQRFEINDWFDHEIMPVPLAYASVFVTQDRGIRDLLRNRTKVLGRNSCR